jgi:general secretion pathway protein A
MYERFYDLRERPFDLTPNPRYLLLTDTHREALGNLEYGISARKGITVLTGEAGTGKTTLIRTAFSRASSDPGRPTSWVYLKNPRLTRSEFLEFLAARFGLPSEMAASKTKLLDELEAQLVEGRRAVLVIDEAQSVPLDLLEEVRLLANIESDTEKLLPVILVGQPELADRLNESALRQLKQRVALRCTLNALSLREAAGYIAGRTEIAGGEPAQIFSREAVLRIFERSRGIPRTISVICDNALLTGYAEEQRPVGARLIETVCRDFDLPQVGKSSVAVAAVTTGPAAVVPAPVAAAPVAATPIAPVQVVPPPPSRMFETDEPMTTAEEPAPAETGVVERLRRWGLRR